MVLNDIEMNDFFIALLIIAGAKGEIRVVFYIKFVEIELMDFKTHFIYILLLF